MEPQTPEAAMPRTINVLVVPLDEDPRLETIKPSLGAWQRLVGGYIQAVPLRLVPGVVVFCNEDGKNPRLGLSINIFASAIAHLLPPSLRPGDLLVGPCVMVGSVNPLTGEEDGEDHDIPLGLINLLRERGVPVRDARP